MPASLPSVKPPRGVVLKPELLTPSEFAPFGTAIQSPFTRELHTVPASLPDPLHPRHQPKPQYANQNTALKTSPISPLTNNYPPSNTSLSRPESKGAMSMFSCFPRKNLYLDSRGNVKLKVSILERHPFTSQTFCPFNHSKGKGIHPQANTYFLVIVAPTISSPTSTPANPPDLSKIRAFIAPTTADGALGMAVTYNAGTWHAPMVVVGQRRVDFLVTQFVNGNADDDCQEVLIGTGFEDGVSNSDVEVDLTELNIDVSAQSSEKRAKL